MICSNCHKENLPGGVRCAYCGKHFPVMPDFDFDVALTGVGGDISSATTASQTPRRKGIGGVMGLLALLLFKGKSLLALLKFGKIALTLGTMFISIQVYAFIWGYSFAAGFVVCIFVHEMGHVFVNWRKGIPSSAPMFIPGFGALIMVKRFPNDPATVAQCGAGGPVAGLLAGLVCWLIGIYTHNPFWYGLASTNMVLNLFNLLPVMGLDGSHMAGAFSPGLWNFILVALLLWVIKVPTGVLWIIILLGFFLRLGRSKDEKYLLARPSERLQIAVVYIALCIAFAYTAQAAMPRRSMLQKYGTTVSSRMPVAEDDDSNTASSAPKLDRSLPSMEESDPGFQLRRSVRTYVYGAMWIGAFLLSMAATLLLAKATGNVAIGKYFIPGIALFGIWVLTYQVLARHVVSQIDGSLQPKIGDIGAWFAGAIAFFIFAVHQAVHFGKSSFKLSWAATCVRAWGWFAGGALLMAYALSDWGIAIAVASLASFFVARFPFVVLNQMAVAYGLLGRISESTQCRENALTLKPDLETEAEIHRALADLNVTLARGGRALHHLDHFEAIRNSILPPEDRDIIDLSAAATRVAALGLLERYSESLTILEMLVHAAPMGAVGKSVLTTVHYQLALMAVFREWPDEAIAQADWCLGVLPKGRHSTIAHVMTIKSVALAGLGKYDEAEVWCAKALKECREPGIESFVIRARLEIAVLTKRADTAAAEATRLKLNGGERLSSLYWIARAGLLRTQSGEALEGMQKLAGEYPGEYWGRRAAKHLEVKT